MSNIHTLTTIKSKEKKKLIDSVNGVRKTNLQILATSKTREKKKLTELVGGIRKANDFYKKMIIEEKEKNGALSGELEAYKKQIIVYDETINEYDQELETCYLKINSLVEENNIASESINTYGLKTSTFDKMMDDCDKMIKDSKNKKIHEIDNEFQIKMDKIKERKQKMKEKYNISNI